MQGTQGDAPRIFISYSHDSTEHMDTVLRLSDRLRSEGVDALIDQYEENPPQGWLTWMQQEIEVADYVLIVCTETYKVRLDKNEEPGLGLGALWESQLIINDLYQLQGRNAKYIPITMSRSAQAFIPPVLQSVTTYCVEDEDGYSKLLRRLTAQNLVEKPPLGRRRELPPRDRHPHTVPASVPAEIVSAATFSYAHPDRPVNEVPHENYVRTITRTLNASKRIDMVAVEGPEGYGKTTLLAQFSRYMRDNCVSLFLEDDDRATYDPDSVKLNFARQAHWILHRSPLERTSIDQQDYQSYVDRLHVYARRKREPLYLIVDGLEELTKNGAGLSRQLVDLLPAPALEGFKYVVSGDAEDVRSLFAVGSTLKSFTLADFDLDETMTLFAGITAELSILRDVHTVCSGNPSHLSSARRLIVRGMKPRDLVDAVSRLTSPMDLEWSMQVRGEDPTKRALAHLAFNDRRSTLPDLAITVGNSVDDLRNKLSRLSVLSIGVNDAVRFRAAYFRKVAQKELYHLRRSVHKVIAQKLLKQSDVVEEILEVPLNYARADDHEQVLAFLSPDHVVELIQRAQSINRVQKAVQLGLTAARDLDRAGDLLRFGLDSAVLNEFFRLGYAVSEVSALAALREYESAAAIARSAVMKEDRLHLLAIIARRKLRNGGTLEPELLQQLTVLANEIDPKPLGRRLANICVELSPVLPDVALDLAEKHDIDETDRERLFTRLSTAAFKVSADLSSSLIDKMKARGYAGRIDLMQNALTAVSGNWTAEEVLANAKKFTKARDRLFVLRAWMKSRTHIDESGSVVEHSLNAAITATDYTITATVLREFAEGLQYIKDEAVIRRVLDIFTAQRGAAHKLGPTVDYIRLEVLLAEAETRWDPSGCETRLLTTFFEITQLTNLEVRAQAWAWFTAGVKRIAASPVIGGALDSVIADSIRELEEAYCALLDATAEHLRVASEIVTTVARWDVGRAIEFARMMNTESRRDRVLVELAAHIMSPECPADGAQAIKDAVLAVASRTRQGWAISEAVVSMSENPSLTSSHFLHFEWLLQQARSIDDARLRTRTLQCAYSILRSRKDADGQQVSSLANDLSQSWDSITTAWHRIEDGFTIAHVLASVDPVLAREYVLKAQTTRRNVGGLTSHAAARTYIRIVRLAIRAFAGLVRRGVTTPSDMGLLALQIDRIPSLGVRAVLWSELALKCASQDNIEMCKEIVNERVRTAIAAIHERDAWYGAYVKARTAPAVFAADTAATQVLLAELNDGLRDHACYLIISYLFRNCLPTDPEDYSTGSGYEITFLRLTQICDVLNHVTSDSLLYFAIERIVDSLVARKNDARIKQGQKDEILHRLSTLVNRKLPNPRFIKHDGWKILALLQINRCRAEHPIDPLISKAKDIPNTSDRGYVLFDIGMSVFRSDRGRGQAIVDAALGLIRTVPSPLERAERLIQFADELRGLADPTARKILKEANTILQGDDVGDTSVIRNLIDVAARVGDDFATELAGVLDDDEAKQAAQRQLELRSLKQRIINETSVADTFRAAQPNEYSDLGRMLLGSLHSGRIDSIRVGSAMKFVEILSQETLSRSYMMMTWIVENAVERHAKDERASFYLRPLFEGVVASSELVSRLADHAFTRDRQKESNAHTPTAKQDAQQLMSREELVEFLRRWITAFTGVQIVIVDPQFTPADLALVRLIRSTNPAARTVIVTSKRSQPATSEGSDLAEIYARHWRDHISEQSPPSTRIAFLDTADCRTPFSETMILTESAGLVLSTTLSGFGVDSLASVRQLDMTEVESVREAVQRFVDGEIEEWHGSKVSFSMFRL